MMSLLYRYTNDADSDADAYRWSREPINLVLFHDRSLSLYVEHFLAFFSGELLEHVLADVLGREPIALQQFRREIVVVHRPASHRVKYLCVCVCVCVCSSSVN